MSDQSPSTASDVVLKVVDLHKYFGDLQVLKGISMEVHQGDVLTMLGASGSGKTTLLKCINFLEEPTSGETYIDGRPMGFRVDDKGRRRQPVATTEVRKWWSEKKCRINGASRQRDPLSVRAS